MPVELLLIHNTPPCRRCRKALRILRDIRDSDEHDVAISEITAGTPEAEKYGAVMTPMLVVNGKVVSAGAVPSRTGLEKLVARESQSSVDT